jgi:hypothetical protein
MHHCLFTETKLQVVDDTTIATTLGYKFVQQYAVLPTVGTRGGIILACFDDYYSFDQVDVRQFFVMVLIRRRIDNEVWALTGVYGPQGDAEKINFMQEIR